MSIRNWIGVVLIASTVVMLGGICVIEPHTAYSWVVWLAYGVQNILLLVLLGYDLKDSR